MKIVHLCLCSFYPDNYSYQENILPKFHKLLGNNVEVIASQESFDENGHHCYLNKSGSYYNEYNIKVTRLKYKNKFKICKKLKRYKGTYQALIDSNADVLFIHGCQFLDIDQIIKYASSRKDLKIYVDNHADFSNSAKNYISRNILHKIIWKKCAKMIEPYTSKFYGVLPARVDFLTQMYGLPKQKCELLVMGADDEYVKIAKNNKTILETKKGLKINSDDFVIITGGKIDAAKQQTLLLMKAVKEIDSDKIRLIIFGSVDENLKKEFSSLLVKGKVEYLGWASTEQSYRYFAVSDLAVFPGRHSVYWEQATGMGVPMICKHWEGTHHIDLGGNVEFIYHDEVKDIKDKICEIVNDTEKFNYMKSVATDKGMKVFSYREIARKCIEG